MIKNIVFAGTPEISAQLLKNLVSNGYKISACYTQPDRPKGRNQLIDYSPVKEVALENNISLIQPKSLKNPEVIQQFKELAPDLMIVFAYGLILPVEILEIPKLGCINVHTSLLPKWRGAAPVQHAILNGDQTTGITIMQMDPGLDTGDILYSLECPIDLTETTESLYKKLQPLATKAILNVLNQLNSNQITAIPQNHQLATYAHKINKLDAKINWLNSAIQLDRFIRGLNPKPVAFTNLNNINIRVWQATILNDHSIEIDKIKNNIYKISQPNGIIKPGTIVNASKYGIDVLVGNFNTNSEINLANNLLRIEKLQLPGSKVLTVAELLNSAKNKSLFSLGEKFEL